MRGAFYNRVWAVRRSTPLAAPEVVCGVRCVCFTSLAVKKNGWPCLRQVIEHRSQPGVDAVSAKEELEATLGLELDHPHIVRTLKFATRQRSGGVRYRLIVCKF